jgi:hypothetical protein
MDREIDSVLARLGRSQFRSRFVIRGRELDYLLRLGAEDLRAHARDLVSKRLAPAEPANDGRQTPMKNHPVFIAQHATATCCRSCLLKWHGIPKGRELSTEEIAWIIKLIAVYCERFMTPHNTKAGSPGKVR